MVVKVWLHINGMELNRSCTMLRSEPKSIEQIYIGIADTYDCLEYNRILFCSKIYGIACMGLLYSVIVVRYDSDND